MRKNGFRDSLNVVRRDDRVTIKERERSGHCLDMEMHPWRNSDSNVLLHCTGCSSLHAVRPCVSDQTHLVLLSVFRHLDRIENVLSNI